METRCIQKTGGSSYIVTLPKEWILHHQLEDKGIVNIDTLPGGQLLIRSRKSKDPARAVITIDYLSNTHVLREIIGMFVSGVEEIVVQARAITYEQRAFVRATSYKLFGFELFEQTSQQIVMKNVASTRITAPEYCMKMAELVYSMYQDVTHVVEHQDKRLAKDVVERDVEVDRIHLMMLRQFNRMLYSIVQEQPADLPLLDLHYYEHVAIRLERMADHMVRIASTILLLKENEKIQLNKFEHANLTKLDEYFSLLKATVASTDKRKAHQVLDLYESHPKNEYMSIKSVSKSALNIMIEDSIERIRSYIANIAEETINYTNVKAVY